MFSHHGNFTRDLRHCHPSLIVGDGMRPGNQQTIGIKACLVVWRRDTHRPRGRRAAGFQIRQRLHIIIFPGLVVEGDIFASCSNRDKLIDCAEKLKRRSKLYDKSERWRTWRVFITVNSTFTILLMFWISWCDAWTIASKISETRRTVHAVNAANMQCRDRVLSLSRD